MRTAIVTGAGKAVGLGHLGRCMALAQAIEAIHRCKPVFLDLDAVSTKWVGERGYSSSKSNRGGWDLVIVDSHDISREGVKSLRASSAELLMLHDVGKFNASCDWILNGAIYAHRVSYAYATCSGLLLGPKFQPLRKEFWRRSSPRTDRGVENVLVTLGGSDVQALLTQVLPVLEATLPAARFHIVAGPHSAPPPTGPRTIVHRSPENVRALIDSCDAAVSAGGQALYEIASCGVPTIAISIANNQHPNVAAFAKAGAALDAGRPGSRGFDVGLKRAVHAMAENSALRASVAAAGRNLVDGQGALRAIRALYPDNLRRK